MKEKSRQVKSESEGRAADGFDHHQERSRWQRAVCGKQMERWPWRGETETVEDGVYWDGARVTLTRKVDSSSCVCLKVLLL